ncbi:hypothetical protein FAES_2628 [Fibrella aestuarina BUZ 2]|uniref:Uncharacterized protein n=1 Tax=Fibrella aestuarina BUZ 2 TaxID=1166018 RepID=I0K934_9BACT|nr:hypothetical protein [Fibrella aestuarina]CCH00637.1 hypothetical protein FAES_2628 [Fibrella aestuarina BUZ 2]
MANKAFYQTFYQTEQLFRRADDALAFPPMGDAPVLVAEVEAPAPPPPVEPPVIGDPVLPAQFPVDQQPEPLADTVDDEPVAVIETVPNEPAPAPAPVPEPIAQPTQPVVSASQQEPIVRRPATPMLSQKVLILVDEDLLPSDLLFLEKILKAVNLDIAGVDLLNIHGTKNIDFTEMLSGKYIHHFFTFGVPFTRLNLDILMDRYQPVRFDGITFLMADPLPVIEADVALKKKLWEALKKIFLWR